MINKKVGIPASAESAGGGVAAARLLGEGKVQLVLTTTADIIDSFSGTGTQTKPLKPRLVVRGHQGIWHLITLTKSGIKTVSDMNGKRYQFDNPASTNKPLGEAVVKCAKLNVKVIPWESSEKTCLDVAAGIIDIGQSSAIGGAAIKELLLTQDVTFVPIPDDVRDCMVKTYIGTVKAVIPKGYYDARGGVKYPPADLPSIGVDMWLFCRADLPDDLVYQIAKAIMDNPKEFSNYHKEAGWYTIDRITQDLGALFAPFHPGVVKYLKEKGKWTDALQKFQDQKLAEEPK